MDITNTNLVAALLDQKVAGVMGSKLYAYVVVLAAPETERQWSLGIAVSGEFGYNALEGPELAWDDLGEAEDFANGMNEHLGLTYREALSIQCASMRRPIDNGRSQLIADAAEAVERFGEDTLEQFAATH